MKRTIFLSVLVVIVIAAAFAAWWFFVRTSSTNSNTNNGNSGQAATISQPEQGAVLFERELVYNEVNFQFTSFSVDTVFHGQTAAEGKQFVAIFFQQLPEGQQQNTVSDWAQQVIKLTADEDRSYGIKEVKVVTAAAGPNSGQGYFLYEADESAANLKLKFGDGDQAQTLDLNI